MTFCTATLLLLNIVISFSLLGQGRASLIDQILLIESQRNYRHPLLAQSLYHRDQLVRKYAIRAMGRMRHKAALEPLLQLTKDSSAEIRKEALYAASQLPSKLPLKFVSQSLMIEENDFTTRQAMWLLTGLKGEKKTQELALKALNIEKNSDVIASICEAIALMWTQENQFWEPPKGLVAKLAEISQYPEPVGSKAAFALSRYRGRWGSSYARVFLNSYQRAKTPQAQLYLMQVINKISSPQVTQFFKKQSYTSPSPIRIEIAKGLKTQPPSQTVNQIYLQLLSDAQTSVIVETLLSLENIKTPHSSLLKKTEELLQKNKSLWVKSQALKTLEKLDRNKSKKYKKFIQNKKNSPLLPALIRVLGAAQDHRELKNYLHSPDVEISAKTLESIRSFSPSLIQKKLKTKDVKRLLSRQNNTLTDLLCQITTKTKRKEWAKLLSNSYKQYLQHQDYYTRINLLNVIAQLQVKSSLNVVKQALKDPIAPVSQKAQEVFSLFSGIRQKASLQQHSQILTTTVSYYESINNLKQKFQVKTNRGTLHYRFIKEAPLTVAHFIRNIQRGIYKKSRIFRVLNNFIVQTGDPMGLGTGGTNKMVRDEFYVGISPKRGMIALSHRGADTGSSPFFINLVDNPHLRGRYTFFAELVSGHSVLDHLELGDQIQSIQLSH